MPSLTKLLRLATLPETRHLIVAASRSHELRDVVHRTRTDRAGLLRNLADPATMVRLVRGAVVHPAARELADVGYVLLPGRYLPAGWAATWLLRRALRRFGDGRDASDGASGTQRSGAPKKVTPQRRGEPPTSTPRRTD